MFEFNTKRTPLLAIVLLLAALHLTACTTNEPPELKQAANVIQNMMAPANLSRSAFSVAFPGGKPSQYVSYLFSTMGSSDWPPSEDWVYEDEREAARSLGIPLVPDGVAFVPRKWTPGGGTQLVISYDDCRGLVILEGYGATDTEPVLRREITLRGVSPAVGVGLLYESNAQMGIGAQSFDPASPVD